MLKNPIIAQLNWEALERIFDGIIRQAMEHGLEQAELLRSELMDFQLRRTPAANLTFSAREGQHDHLVLSLAIALWWGERPQGVFFA